MKLEKTNTLKFGRNLGGANEQSSGRRGVLTGVLYEPSESLPESKAKKEEDVVYLKVAGGLLDLREERN